ncbi:MAG: hypothetical protein R3C51_14870 [Parvularculaceae bacterium]
MRHSDLIVATLMLGVCGCAGEAGSEKIDTNITWEDGDSGEIDNIGFQLANVDAPETGDAGARDGAACQAERDKGLAAVAYMQELTRNARLEITKEFGHDPFGRMVINLSANGKDVAQTAIAAGHLRPWPYANGKPLTAKPDWCAIASE